MACVLRGLVVALAAAGCTRAAAPAGIPVVVVPVGAVDARSLTVVASAPQAAPPAAADDFAPGDRVEIQWMGSWLPATLVERRGDRWLVRYEAGEDDDREYAEETVERERIRQASPRIYDEGVEVDVDP